MNKKIARLLIGSGENSPEIRYMTGISTPDDFICAEAGGVVLALLSPLEFSRGRDSAKPGVRVEPEASYGKNRTEIITALAAELDVEGFEVPFSFPLGIADKLRSEKLEITVSQENFCPGRLCKDSAEAAAVTAAQRAGEAGFARAAAVLAEAETGRDSVIFWQGVPLTSEILRAEIDCAILRNGSLPTGTICAGGKQSAQPHNSGSGILYAHTPIVMDIFPRNPVSGYWGDLTRTVVKGKAPDTVKRAYDAVLEARETAKAAVSPGCRCAELHKIAAQVLDNHRFFTGTSESNPFGFIHSLGHGVGLEIHEAPRLSPRSQEKLCGGEIFTIEPGVYYPEWGGIRLEDLIYLTPDGKVKCLTEAADFLEID